MVGWFCFDHYLQTTSANMWVTVVAAGVFISSLAENF